ncbi:cache domain-containing sensor histidine kinase [Paenibacillus monticola]|uniref:HAMP domain-containing protein n=1 Tax=Paenibacillus monticola TaxID=2666075 RepID=A0A7X2L1F5_9BACL|nr:sensor histidine kinase [Paenibacillus monticola]MRN53767.1 HAMP domain-containing protein [Paenibacillus monticola]
MYRKFGRGRVQASLQTKFFLTFMLLLLIVLGCFLVYVNIMVIHPLKDKTENEMKMAAAKVSDQLNLYINNQNQLSQRILSNKDIFTLLSAGDYSKLTLEGLTRSRRLRDIMFQALGPSRNIEDMIIYNLKGAEVASYIGYAGNPTSLVPFLEESGKLTTWSASGYAVYRQPTNVISFVRAIMNQNGQVFGYLAIQLDQEYLKRSAAGIANSKVYIVDMENQLISSSPVLQQGEEVPDFAASTSVTGIYLDSNQNYVAYNRSAETGWTTYVVTSKSFVLGPVNSVKYISILLITALILFSFIFIYFSTKNLLLPIRKLRSQILRINYSNMNVKADTRTHNNELIQLNGAFQELLERLQESIEREKFALHEEVKSRNSALQAQIAPHFIHNVLYLISIAAQEGKNVVVTEMCKHLSDSLRYIVSSPYQHVTLTEELKHTQHYLSLIQHNFEDDLEWEIDEDELFDLIELPRLVIQPFVENCIEHAFKNTDPPWKIQVRVKVYNGLWAIEIRDNGDGFEPGKIKGILDNIHGSDSGVYELQNNTSGIGNMGIVNTVNRLKLMYKNRLFFNIYHHSEEGKGATVQIIASMSKDFY